MIGDRSTLGRAVPPLVVAAAVSVAGCFQRSAEAPPVAPAPAQVVLTDPVSVPRPTDPAAPAMILPQEQEPYVDNMVMVDAPVRLVLQRLAEIGKLDLIIPANITKRISVQYVHVPVSVALNDVLARSGLRLGTATSAPLPFDTVTVFYKLPANVDSMSAEAIVRRFGVSQAVADLIVKTRKPPP